jgi:hypothetical protein
MILCTAAKPQEVRMSQSTWSSRVQSPWLIRPEAMVGAAFPLWGYFTGAALAGTGWWWMTHWTGPAQRAEEAAEPAVEAVAETADGLATVAEAVAEPALEILAEAAGGPVAEALAGDEMPVLPVGGESAPFGAAALAAEMLSDPEIAEDLKNDLGQPPPRPPRSRKPRQEEDKPKPH